MDLLYFKDTTVRLIIDFKKKKMNLNHVITRYNSAPLPKNK